MLIRFLTIAVLATTVCWPAQAELLRGVTVQSKPFVSWSNNSQSFEGFCIDLLDEMAKLANFSYELHQAADRKYGMEKSTGVFNGMIGEVQRKESDFAVADITVTPQRAGVVDFTEPFFNLTFAAVVRKSVNRANITRIDQLGDQTDFSYGFLSSGATFAFFQSSQDPKIRAIYEFVNRNSSLATRSYAEGLVKVKSEEYAFIGESPLINYVADNDCELEVIAFNGSFTKFYAFAVQKESPHLERFNQAIRQLRDEGKIQQLQAKYWQRNCLATGVQTNS